MDYPLIVIGLVVVGIIIADFKYHAGERDKIHKRVDKTVLREDCHRAVDGMKTMINDYDENMDRRFSDLKDFIKNNGK